MLLNLRNMYLSMMYWSSKMKMTYQLYSTIYEMYNEHEVGRVKLWGIRVTVWLSINLNRSKKYMYKPKRSGWNMWKLMCKQVSVANKFNKYWVKHMLRQTSTGWNTCWGRESNYKVNEQVMIYTEEEAHWSTEIVCQF